ncbi:MAG: Xaa-Pro peptidase family protein [Acidobacteriota bacterium]|nr:Xaa-Pro peptidase family protein [Acidobacteriota bacterium]
MRPFAARLAAAASEAERAGADALLITNPANILYLSGFGGSSARLLLTRGRLYFMTDFRYSRSIADLASAWPGDSQVIEITGSYDDGLEGLIGRLRPVRLGFEAGHATVTQHRAWAARLSGVEFVATDRIVERARVIKDAGELATMRDAGRRVSAIAARLADWVRSGRRERDIAADVNHAMAHAGFSRPAFDTIVASGPHAALPHARPGDRQVARGDLVVVDFGGMLDGYAVDITRTLSVGPAGEREAHLHAAVLEAQAAAVSVLRPGARVQDIDSAARAALDRHGYGGAARHAVGHGLGLDVHEEPRLSRDAPAGTPPMAAGMVVTIEPGAYLDDGPGMATGVRIEDDLLVGEERPEWLTSAPRELIATD